MRYAIVGSLTRVTRAGNRGGLFSCMASVRRFGPRPLVGWNYRRIVAQNAAGPGEVWSCHPLAAYRPACLLAVHHAALHHEGDFLERADILERVALHRDRVSQVTRPQRA